MIGKTEAAPRKVTLRCPFCLKWNRIDLSRSADRPKCGECGRPFLLDRPVKVTDDDLERLVEDAEVPVVVDFYADWCAPCKVMAPLLDEFARRYLGEVLVAKLDTDRNPRMSGRYQVRGIPTLILFRDGSEVTREVGAVPVERIEALLDRKG
ncbi:MAG: thioredoxin [Gemmatimonadota bacterium]